VGDPDGVNKTGAGAWARDPEVILVTTPHEEPDCYTVSSILRCLPPKQDFVVEWQYPLMRLTGLDTSALKSGATKQKKWTDREFIEMCVPEKPTRLKDGARRTVMRYLKRLVEAGVICYASGLYWRKEVPGNTEECHSATPL
jgi:hypothetical protein